MLNGRIISILTQKDNDWGRYQIDEYGKETLAVGVIPGASVGMTVLLDGELKNNQYGTQFMIKSVLKAEKDKYAGMRKFLSCGFIKGIKETTANKIVDVLGDDVERAIEEDGGIRLTKVPGISTKKLAGIIESYNENKKYKDIVLCLNGGVTKRQTLQIYEKYGEKAVSILKKNPYRLQGEIPGFGFLRTDTLALASGVKPDSVFRIAAAITYVLESASNLNGHCFLYMDEVKDSISKLLIPTPKFQDVGEQAVENALAGWPESKEKFLKAHDVTMDVVDKISETYEGRKSLLDSLPEALEIAIGNNTVVNDDGKIYLRKLYYCECESADLIAKMINSNPVRFIPMDVIEKAVSIVEKRKTQASQDKNFLFKITPEQRKAVNVGVMNRIAIISGGPGRGKTAISEIIALSFIMAGQCKKEDIIMLAPTGRAAQRITESTGYSAATIHRAVNEPYIPSNKLILVDESSMVDIYLLHKLLKYAKDCNLVFVGDVNQIASVGPGKILQDFIASGKIPCILLQQGHRNGGSIAHNSELINEGRKIDSYCYDENFKYTPATKENIRQIIIDDYKEMIKKYGIKEVMLATAMKRGPLSVIDLNKLLQNELTSGPEVVVGDMKFRLGDRVMQTKNDYEFVVKRPNGEQGLGIFNGERGTVVKVYPETMQLIVMFDDGTLGGYSSQTLNNLTLAYATTMHKCQGSEAKCLMTGYVFGDYLLLKRRLFYTAVTRGKKEVRLYGEEKWQYGKMLSAFDVAVRNNDDENRNTYLSERISQMVA